jgi:hypothetical protein
MNDEQPMDETEFEAALSSLVGRAAGDGVDVAGGWDVREDGDVVWTVEISRVSSRGPNG